MKKGQITIFIIVGVILVVGIGLFLFIQGDFVEKITGTDQINPNSFLSNCLEDKILESVYFISHQGGEINPELYKTFKFQSDERFWNISYSCYTKNFYGPCVNQKPMLITDIEKEIHNYVSEEVSICLNELENSLERKNYDVSKIYNGFKVELIPGKIKIDLNGELSYSKTKETSRIENFNIWIPSRIYDLAVVASEINSQESEFCEFSKEGFMLLYPDYDINLYRVEHTKIYTIGWRENDEKFRIAIRGCAIL